MKRLIDKYRPESLDDLIGQPFVQKFFSNYVEGEFYKISREIILHSKVGGVGKTTVAMIVASMITDDKFILSFNGHEYSSVEKIKYVSEISKTVMPEGKFRVIIIDEFHRLSKQAQAEFLELLEFKAHNTIFLFTTTDLDGIESPLRTRCLEIGFGPVPVDDQIKVLREICESEGWEVKNELLDHIVLSSGGSMRNSITRLLPLYIAGGEIDRSVPLFEGIKSIIHGNFDNADMHLRFIAEEEIEYAVPSLLRRMFIDPSPEWKEYVPLIKPYLKKLIDQYLIYKPKNSEELFLWARMSIGDSLPEIKKEVRKERRTIHNVDKVSNFMKKRGWKKKSEDELPE